VLLVTTAPLPDEFGNIGSELLGMTLLQQQNRVQRSAKETVRINGRMTSLTGPSLTACRRCETTLRVVTKSGRWFALAGALWAGA
jgi:hypothetical protein